MKNVLITGVSGFVGAHLARKLLRMGVEVTGITRGIKRQTCLNLLRIDKGDINLVQGNILNYFTLEAIISEFEIDTIFHLAAQTIVKKGFSSPITTFQTNIQGTWNLLEAARRCGVERFLYVSTDKVYGNNETPYTEDLPLLATDPYSASKACADTLARAYAKNYDMPICVSRACNIIGPADLNPRIVPNTIRTVLKGNQPVIYKGIKHLREYIYVEDCVEAYITLLKHMNITRGRAFNVGSGHVKTQGDVVNTIANLWGVKPKYVQPKAYMKKEIQDSYLSSEKIRETIGWKAKTSFNKAVLNTIEWWKINWDQIQHP